MSEASYWENNVSKKTKQAFVNAIGPLNLANQQKIHSDLTAFGLQDRILASVTGWRSSELCEDGCPLLAARRYDDDVDEVTIAIDRCRNLFYSRTREYNFHKTVFLNYREHCLARAGQRAARVDHDACWPL